MIRPTFRAHNCQAALLGARCDLLLGVTIDTDRVAIITGGARGIGRAIALDLAAQGWGTVVGYRTSPHDVSFVVDEARAAGGRAMSLQADVADAAQADHLVGQVLAQWGRVDALINAAGSYQRAHILQADAHTLEALIGDNLYTVLYMCRAVADPMSRAGWGRIINFGVANAESPRVSSHVAAHHIAKCAVLVLTRTLARELAPHRVTVNAISPGYVDTGHLSEAEIGDAVARIPAGYVGTVADVVAVVRFLLSEEARYVNGANIVVSGAWGI
jgi:3-oxoacyl-[acyl-carrier protein] reductase